MTKNIPLFTYVFAAYFATQKYHNQQALSPESLDWLISNNVYLLSEMRKRMKEAPHLRLGSQTFSKNLPNVAVLVVEQDIRVCLEIVQKAEENNFEVFIARDSTEAVSTLHLRPNIQIVLSDVVISESQDGVKFANYITEKWPSMEIILAFDRLITSANDLPEKCVLVKKPFETQQIVSIIQQLVRHG